MSQSVNGNADELEALITEFQKWDMRELHLRCPDFELYLSKDPNSAGFSTPAPVPPIAPAASVSTSAPASAPAAVKPAHTTPAAEASWPADAVLVRAPYLGTFYRSPKPGGDPYVELGAAVGAEQELCLMEVMKLFTAVRAGTGGRVHAILVADGDMVEAGQALFVLVPG